MLNFERNNHFSFDGAGVLICSIDNMPTQLPLEATEFFGSRLLPLIPLIADVDAKKNFQQQTNISRAIRDVGFSLMIYYSFDFLSFVNRQL